MDANPPPLHGQPYAGLTPPQNSGLAIASLVLGCAAFLCFGLTAIPAVICGHLALSRIGKSGGRLTGSGMAIAGLVTGYLMTVLFAISTVAILAGIALPVFGEVQDRGNQTRALAQLKQIGTACQLYAQDHDGKFPPQLADLVPDYLPDLSATVCTYPDPKNPVPYEYFGGSKNDPPGQLLAASPVVPNKGRIFLSVDGSVQAKSRTALKREGTGALNR